MFSALRQVQKWSTEWKYMWNLIFPYLLSAAEQIYERTMNDSFSLHNELANYWNKRDICDWIIEKNFSEWRKFSWDGDQSFVTLQTVYLKYWEAFLVIQTAGILLVIPARLRVTEECTSASWFYLIFRTVCWMGGHTCSLNVDHTQACTYTSTHTHISYHLTVHNAFSRMGTYSKLTLLSSYGVATTPDWLTVTPGTLFELGLKMYLYGGNHSHFCRLSRRLLPSLVHFVNT